MLHRHARVPAAHTSAVIVRQIRNSLMSTSWLLALGLVLAVLFHVGTAAGQGRGMPLIPDPITTPELREYGDMLGLSDQQRLALFEMHDAHQQRYREMQDREVTRLVNQILELGMRFVGGNFAFPTRDEVRQVSSLYRGILSQARRIDSEFFNGLIVVLTEEQQLRLDRVRQQREMRLYEELVVNAVRELNPGAVVDMSALIAELEISPMEREQIEPIIAQYESSRLRQMRQGIDLIEQVVMSALDIVDEYGLRDMTMEQMMQLGQRPEFLEDMRARVDSLSVPFQTAAHEASQRNVQTHNQLAMFLSPRNAWELRDQYYRQAYRQVYDGPGDWRHRYISALRMLDLSEDLQEAIGVQREQFDRSDASMVDSIVAELEKYREYRTVAQFEREDRDEIQEKIRDYRERRTAMHASASDLLDGLLGPDLVAQLQQHVRAEREQEREEAANAQQDRVEVVVSADGSGLAASLTSFSRQVQPDDAFMPYPLTAQDMAMLQAFLDIKAGQQEVVHVMFDSYRERYERLRTARRDTEESSQAEGQSESTPTQDVRRKREAFDSLSAADREFFDDLGLVIGEARAARYVRWMHGLRQRQAAATLARGLAPAWGQQEAFVDLVGLMLQHTTAHALPDTVDAVIDEYTSRLEPIVAERAEAATERYRYTLSLERAQQSGDAPQNVLASLNSRREESTRAVMQVNQQVIQINRQILDRLLDQLNEQDAWNLRWEYNKVAYPGIFDEASSAQKYFDAVLKMADLSAFQRDRINDQMLSYRQRYFEVSEEMVELRQGRDIDFTRFQMPSQDDIKREMRLEQLRFDRRELANRAKYQLQLVLQEEQIDRIPELRQLQ